MKAELKMTSVVWFQCTGTNAYNIILFNALTFEDSLKYLLSCADVRSSLSVFVPFFEPLTYDLSTDDMFIMQRCHLLSCTKDAFAPVEIR